MTLQASYLGAQAVGADTFFPTAGVTYTVPISIPAGGGWLVAIESAWEGWSSSTLVLRAGIYADDGSGQPGDLLYPWLGQSRPVGITDALVRWVTCPVGVWLAAGDYHVGVCLPSAPGGPLLHVETGGASGDGHTVDGSIATAMPDGDYSSAVAAATTSTYSVRAVVFVETVGPDTPINVTATALSSTSIRVDWSDVLGATSYIVERSDDGITGWTTVGTPATNSFPDTGLTCNTAYFYRISAVNAGGTSSPSSVAGGTTDPCSPSSGNRMGGTGAIRRRGGHPR